MISASTKKITLTEREALTLPHNLADAQNYTLRTAAQAHVIDNLPVIFRDADAAHYGQLRNDFLTSLFERLEQPAALAEQNTSLLCYSATIGLEVALSYASQRISTDQTVGLLHPTFDSLAYISRRQGLDIRPISEAEIVNPETSLDENFGAVVLTLPNNPTGFLLREEQFSRVAEVCSELGILLIVDACYRDYIEESLRFDAYQILQETGVDYTVVEDTGKLFPLVDQKVGILCCPNGILEEIESIHSDFLLEVSKFTLSVITQFMANQSHEQRRDYAQLIGRNREAVKKTLSSVGAVVRESQNVNVQLVELPARVDSTDLQVALASKGVGIVDAKRFFWANAPETAQIRLPLSRDPDEFDTGLEIVRQTIEEMSGE